MHHKGTWELGVATGEGEQEIACNYKYKADIIGPASCSMAIKLETRKQAQKVEGTAHRRAGDTTRHGQQQSQLGMLTAVLQFKEPLLYGDQDKHSNCLMPTLIAMPQHGLGWGSEQDMDLPGQQRDMHSKEACSSTASETRDDGRHGTTDTVRANLPNLQMPGNPFSRTIDRTISTGQVESDNTGLNPPRLQATGESITGAN
jgi:hypothetical protein